MLRILLPIFLFHITALEVSSDPPASVGSFLSVFLSFFVHVAIITAWEQEQPPLHVGLVRLSVRL